MARSSANELTDEDYWLLRDSLIDEGLLEQGRGRGGSVHRVRTVVPTSAPPTAPVAGGDAEVAVAEETAPEVAAVRETELYDPFQLAHERVGPSAPLDLLRLQPVE
jgi:hypothetical protein